MSGQKQRFFGLRHLQTRNVKLPPNLDWNFLTVDENKLVEIISETVETHRQKKIQADLDRLKKNKLLELAPKLDPYYWDTVPWSQALLWVGVLEEIRDKRILKFVLDELFPINSDVIFWRLKYEEVVNINNQYNAVLSATHKGMIKLRKSIKEEQEKRVFSSKKAIKARYESDEKQQAKREIKEKWKALSSKRRADRYKMDFANEMLKEYKIFQNPNVITNWCRQWEKEEKQFTAKNIHSTP